MVSIKSFYTDLRNKTRGANNPQTLKFLGRKGDNLASQLSGPDRKVALKENGRNRRLINSRLKKLKR